MLGSHIIDLLTYLDLGRYTSTLYLVTKSFNNLL